MKNLKLNIEKNIGYLKFDNKKRKVDKSIEIGDNFIVDLNSDGEIIGIELLNPIEQLGIKYKNSYLYPTNLIEKIAFSIRDGK
ncbi:MAG: DUF2283 domain-containing protein [Ignavibacteria bacterium]|nr:DUF2283 domain-containing protein [Ignavibacteria bacterium]